LLALVYNLGPTAACAQNILPYERDYNTYNRFEQLHSKSCGPTCSTMLLDDMGFPTNLEGASRYYAPNKPYYNYNKNILRNYKNMGMTDNELQITGFKDQYGPEYSGSQPKDLARSLNPERKTAGGRYRRALPVSDPDVTETDLEDITEGDATVGSDRSKQTQGTEKTSSKGTQGSEKTKGSSAPGETEPQPPGVGEIGKEGAKAAGFAVVQALIVCSMQPYDSYGECLKKEGKSLPMAFAIGAVAATGPAAGVVVGGLGIIAFAAQVINTGVEYYKALAANQEWYAALAAQRKNHTDDQEDINEKRRLPWGTRNRHGKTCGPS
jgi:hypothetical protein